jgi:hypothetical protein
MRGGVAVALCSIAVAAVFERQRSHAFHTDYRIEFVTFQAGAGLLMALLVGWLVARLDEQRATAEQRAEEAEALRDELGRRADLLEAANRCARALNSSLDLDEAFGAFIRELRGLVPFDRMAIVLAEEGAARVIATAGDPQTWRDLAWLIVHSVTGLAFGCVALTCVATTLGLAVAPAWYWSLPDGLDFGIFRADTLGEAFAVVPLAVPAAAATLMLPITPSSASAPMTVSRSRCPHGAVPGARRPRAARA